MTGMNDIIVTVVKALKQWIRKVPWFYDLRALQQERCYYATMRIDYIAPDHACCSSAAPSATEQCGLLTLSR